VYICVGLWLNLTSNNFHNLFQTGLRGWLHIFLLTYMFVVWKILQLCMMRSIIPADLQFVSRIEPKVAISLKSLAGPLFGNTQVSSG